MNTLKDFLLKHLSPKNGETNVTSLDGKWGGRWLIPIDRYDEFLKLYFDVVQKDNLKLVEKKRNNAELFNMFADIDISKESITEHFAGLLPKGLMKTIVESYVRVLNEIFVFTKGSEELVNPIISCRLEQPGKCHLHWPGLIVDNMIGKLVREQVVTIVTTKIPGNWAKWIDAASYTCTGLRMLGSLKPYERRLNRYYIVEGFNDDNREQKPAMDLSYDDIKRTSIRVTLTNPILHTLSLEGEEKLQRFQEKQIVIKPTISVLNPSSSASSASASHGVALNDELTKIQQTCIEQGFIRSWTKDYYPEETLKSFSLGPIKVMGGDHYTMANREKILCPIKGAPHKRDCGCNYHVMGPGGTYIKCHDEQCKGKRYPAQPIPLPEDIKQVLYIKNLNINTINNNNTTITKKHTGDHENSLLLDYWCDESIKVFDDPQKDQILLQALNGGETSMGYLLELCGRDKFYYTKEEGWWYWNEIRWQKEQKELMRFLYTQIVPIIRKARIAYKEATNLHIENKDAKIKQIDLLLKKLETRDLKLKILGEAEWIFTNDGLNNLYNLLDNNPHLVGFPNGVFDLSKMEFRKSKYDDYISIIMSYDYIEKVNADMIRVAELNEFLESIMPDNHDRRYLLKFLASGLLGANPNELFHIFTGSGRNGKSKLAELIKHTFGEYYESFSSSFLTSKINSPGQATPHLMALRKKRLIIGSEPDHQFKLNATLIKSLSGNDEIVGRQLYGENKNFRPCFKMILLCNNIPEIDSVDKAVWRRCRCLSFPTSFVSDPKLPHERKIDEQLSGRLSGWQLPFFHLLLEYYSIYLSEGLEMTPNMISRTKDYQVASDVYLEWINDRTEKCDGNIHTCVLYADFKNWHYENYQGKKIPSQTEFAKGIGIHKELKKSIWYCGHTKQGVEKLRLICIPDPP